MGMSPKSNAEFEAHIKGLREIIKSFPVTPKEVIESESDNSVVVWATSRPYFYPEFMDGDDKDWDYQGEYIFVLSFEQTGERIERVLEFLDSAATQRMRGLVARAKKRKEEDEKGQK